MLPLRRRRLVVARQADLADAARDGVVEVDEEAGEQEAEVGGEGAEQEAGRSSIASW
jgi:hypothetical protein